ncbi:MAG: hypothetical protein ACYS83_12620 [Planctomycetota bacterium]|jgi:hypothetical protein
MDKYVEVFAASDITFAYLMKANLETAGIPVVKQARRIIEEIQQSSQNDQDEDELEKWENWKDKE